MCSIDNVDSLTAQNGGNSVDSIESCSNKQPMNTTATAPVASPMPMSMPISNHRADHDYEVIKKDDLMRKLNSIEMSPKTMQHQQQQTIVKHNPVVANFNDSITYSLLNTKIAEESEDNEDDENAHAAAAAAVNQDVIGLDQDKTKKLQLIQPDLLTNSFAYLKLSSDDRSSLELKSLSLRESSSNNDNQLYNMRRSSNNSHSYSANSKSNVKHLLLFSFLFFFFYLFIYLLLLLRSITILAIRT